MSNKKDLIQEVIERLTRCMRVAGLEGWKKFGLSHAQVGLLFMLSYHKDASPNQIASFLGVTKSAITQLVEPLMIKGLVTRVPDPKDRRVARLSLSADGKKAIRQLAAYKAAGLRSALENLNERELEHLNNIFSKIAPVKGGKN